MPERLLPGGIVVTTWPTAPVDFDGHRSDGNVTGVPYASPWFDPPQRLVEITRPMRYIEPAFTVWDRGPGPFPTVHPDAVGASTNWAGGLVPTPFGDRVWQVFAEWNIPALLRLGAETPPRRHYGVQTWVGIDGMSDGTLLRAGCSARLLPEHTRTTVCGPWFEWCPRQRYWIDNWPTISPGSSVACLVQCLPSGPGSLSAVGRIMFIDFGAEVFTLFRIDAPAGDTLAGSSAEWIVEAETAALPFYEPVAFTDCAAATLNGGILAAGKGVALNWTDPSSVTTSETWLVGAGMVQVICL
jgi:hypothetical protein